MKSTLLVLPHFSSTATVTCQLSSAQQRPLAAQNTANLNHRTKNGSQKENYMCSRVGSHHRAHNRIFSQYYCQDMMLLPRLSAAAFHLERFASHNIMKVVWRIHVRNQSVFQWINTKYSAGLIYPPAVFTQSALRSRVHDNVGADSVSSAGC